MTVRNKRQPRERRRKGFPFSPAWRGMGWGIALGVLSLHLFALTCFGGNCYIGLAGFAVTEPNLMQRVCHLYAHEMRTYGPNPEGPAYLVINAVELNIDNLHRDFLQLRQDRKFVALTPGTQVFDCGYDLEGLKSDRDFAKLKGYAMPESSCNGTIFVMVPVRLSKTGSCMWVAEAQVRCDVQIPFKRTPFDLFEEELRD